MDGLNSVSKTIFPVNIFLITFISFNFARKCGPPSKGSTCFVYLNPIASNIFLTGLVSFPTFPIADSGFHGKESFINFFSRIKS